MGESLAQRRADMVRRCMEQVESLRRPMLFGMTTSLVLQSVPLPDDCPFGTDLLHSVSGSKRKRIRARGVRHHTWSPLRHAHNVCIGTCVGQRAYALDLFHTWAQMSPYLSLPSLVMLGESVITSIARQRELANGRTSEQIHADMQLFLERIPRFTGKCKCARAMALIRPNVDSPQETKTRLMLSSHGLPECVVNYAVPGVSFDSGVAMTLDMAWPDYHVAVEYDGDHHRVDRDQWRRDRSKRGRLNGRDWVVFTATAATLADAAASAEFAFGVARQLTLRGASFPFHVVARSLE
ncbi:hypothetical protein KIH78_06950 [Bifidobacterium sp. 79T10]|nr:hypothetical protein [Bifidobacterium saguinibicoloris]